MRTPRPQRYGPICGRDRDVLDLNFLERIKTLAIVAMFSDDDLMERLVLKGGNALDIVYGALPAPP